MEDEIEDRDEYREYQKKRHLGIKKSSWRVFWIFVAVVFSFAAFGMAVYGVWKIDHNIINDIEIIDGSKKRDFDDDFTEEDARAVSQGGMLIQKSGKKAIITTTQYGLAVQKIKSDLKGSSKLLLINSGAVSVQAGVGMSVTSSPVFKRDADEETEENVDEYQNDNAERAILISGKSYTVKSGSVLRVESRLAKRDIEESERGVVTPSSTGIDVTGSDQEPNIINTGVLTITPGDGIVNNGTAQDVILQSSTPILFVTVTISHTDLASAGSKVLYTASSPTATYRIVDLATVVTGSANFTGGDRIIDIGTASEQKWYISANAAATTGTTSLTTSVGNTGIQPSSTVNALTNTVAGANIVAKYSGGATDYTAGSVSITLVLIQTTF